VIGDKDVTPALEMGVRFMREGDTSLVYSNSKYAYGPLGRKQGDYVLPPNSNIMYRVKIKTLVSDGTVYHSSAFQMEIAKSKKKMGNDVYQFEWSDGYGKGKALQLYNKAADSMTHLVVGTEDEKVQKEATAILVDCLNNVAAVHLKAKEYGKAKEAAVKVIQRDPDNMKALLRAARAAIYDRAGTFEESEAAIAAAEEVNPDDSDLSKLKVELERKKKEYKKKSKAMFSKMSSAMKPEPGAEQQATTVSSAKEVPETPKNDDTDAPPTDSNEIGTVDENNVVSTKVSWKIYAPYLLQILMPFVTWYVFTLMRKDSDDRINAELSNEGTETPQL
jgi:tetratricopeptide (TPR) repeat protein